MKKLLLVKLLCISALFVQAQLYSNLTFFTPQGERFQVVINGKLQNIDPQTNVKVEGVEEEYVASKIIFEDQTLGTIDQKLYIPIGNEYTYEIRKNTKGTKFVIRPMGQKPINNVGSDLSNNTPNNTGNMDMNPNPRPSNTDNGGNGNAGNSGANNGNGNANGGNNNQNANNQNQNTTININLGGIIPTTGTTTPPNNGNNGNNGGNNGSNWNNNPPVNAGGNHGSNNNGGWGNHNNTPAYSGYCPAPMNESDFEGLLQAVEGEAFKDQQTALVKQALASGCVSVSQISRLLEKFSFEDSKLEVAKYAYTKCCDPQNYYKLNSSFAFNSNKDALNQYVASQPKPQTQAHVSSNGGWGKPVHNNNGNGCIAPMDGAAFSNVETAVKNEGIDSNRLKLAKQATASNCLSTSQIKEIVKLMSFESSKLEYAKYAYDFCYDKNNYFMINDAFSFSSSSKSLSDYIMSKK